MIVLNAIGSFESESIDFKVVLISNPFILFPRNPHPRWVVATVIDGKPLIHSAFSLKNFSDSLTTLIFPSGLSSISLRVNPSEIVFPVMASVKFEDAATMTLFGTSEFVTACTGKFPTTTQSAWMLPELSSR